MAASGDRLRFEHSSARGSFWVEVDLTEGTLVWNQSGGAPRSLDPETIAALRALAEGVRPEHTSLQPSDLTYAQNERLLVVLDGTRVDIDGSNGEISVGPPHALIAAMWREAHARSEG